MRPNRLLVRRRQPLRFANHGALGSRKLVGELVLFNYMQDSARHCALGQITEIVMRNICEDPTIRSVSAAQWMP